MRQQKTVAKEPKVASQRRKGDRARGMCLLPLEEAVGSGEGTGIPRCLHQGETVVRSCREGMDLHRDWVCRDWVCRDWVSKDWEERWEAEDEEMDRGY